VRMQIPGIDLKVDPVVGKRDDEEKHAFAKESIERKLNTTLALTRLDHVLSQ